MEALLSQLFDFEVSGLRDAGIISIVKVFINLVFVRGVFFVIVRAFTLTLSAS